MAFTFSDELDLFVPGSSEIGGEIYVAGSKNAANKILSAVPAIPGEFRISDLPEIEDIENYLLVLNAQGLGVERSDDYICLNSIDASPDPSGIQVSPKTAGIFGLAGSFLGRFGEVSLGLPGGDEIGTRAIDIHLDGFSSLGATVEQGDGIIRAHMNGVPSDAYFSLPIPSIGATVNLVNLIVGSRGSGELHNTPLEPDMISYYEFLRQCGIKVLYYDSSVKVDARNLPESVENSTIIPPDRNEAFTLFSYGAMSAEGLQISNVDLGSVNPGIEVLRQIGVEFKLIDDNAVIVSRGRLHGERLRLATGHGMNRLHTDWAPLLGPLLAPRPGQTTLSETRHERRIRHAEVLQQMGADIQIHGNFDPTLDIIFSDRTNPQNVFEFAGDSQLHGVDVEVGYDIRAAMTAILGASQAEGDSILRRVGAVHRGHENVLARLASIGIRVSVIEDN